ncbi:MAG TPA: SIR2 family protein [Anaerohalosphaeraceae bacterium]|nr:SIR2 family protein [Anaerohalosphaeraceae bacterium]HQG06094.1 SIR2 family protein [Anaerohalosphaeraceae bacterium]HQI07491.1 SIR2 family protein [Anaerohalosphaeraceae bacterium]HQJ67803.1 SIR2 family protein [Anaerohalosphaeraceae bacterium]
MAETDTEKDFINTLKSSDGQNKHFLKLFDKTGQEFVHFTGVGEEDKKSLEELKLRITCFFQEALKLDTVSFLFGTGSSKPLGAESINEIPSSICQKIQQGGVKNACKMVVDSISDNKCDTNAGCKINLEKLLGDLIRLNNVTTCFKGILNFKTDDAKKGEDDKEPDISNKVLELIRLIKQELFTSCNVPITGRVFKEYEADPLIVHKEFIKKVLARPLNLKRINLFTTNYDLAFEKTMDALGVIYIDGFVGNIKRTFKPEVYNYDYYFPASTTEGRVHRLDKVVHLYKLHGSLDWVEYSPDSKNIYGIEQKKDSARFDESIIIYPQPMKEEETLGFPYSEMFRRFASIIQQPQNVLITYGYGFGDEHINRVIYNALSISTFHLIVVSYGWTESLKRFYEMAKEDSRISFLIGEYLGDWKRFVYEMLPDIKQLELEENIVKTMKKLKGEDKTEGDE